MQTNRVKKIIREGGLVLGAYVGGIADPQIVEIINRVADAVRKGGIARFALPTNKTGVPAQRGAVARALRRVRQLLTDT